MTWQLRPLRAADQDVVLDAAVLCRQEGMDLLPDLYDFDSFEDYVQSVQPDTIRGEKGAMFLLAWENDILLGLVCFRWGLGQWEKYEEGNLGYVTLPQHRRRGVALWMLQESLPVWNSLGVAHVLLTIRQDNFPSLRVAEKAGANVLGEMVSRKGVALRGFALSTGGGAILPPSGTVPA